MKNAFFLFAAGLFLLFNSTSCVNSCGRDDSEVNEESLETIKEREMVEEYLQIEFESEDPENDSVDDTDSLKKERKKSTLEEINKSTYKDMTCIAILDSLQSCIKIYEAEGDLGVLGYFSDLQGDAYFKACIKSNDAFKEKFNNLYKELGEIRAEKEGVDLDI